MSNDNQQYVVKNITKNVIKTTKIWRFDKYMLAEAIVMTLLTIVIVSKINFTQTVTLVILTISCPTVFYVFIRGIKNRSVIQLLWDEIRYRRSYRQLHLRSIDYVKTQNNSAGIHIQGDSIAEKGFFVVSRIIKNIWKRYK